MVSVNDDGGPRPYFAYGTLLGADTMKQYCPGAVTLGVAAASDRSLGFSKYSEDPVAGGCDLLSAPGEVTFGVLYQLADEEMLNLDDVSGVGRGWYNRIPIDVEQDGGETIAACTYVVPSPIDSFSPDEAYLELVRHGARTAGLPDAYIQKLSEMLDDVSSSRHP